MEIEKLTKLATARRKLDAQVKAEVAATAEAVKERKAKVDQIDEVLGKVINKSGDKGTMKSFKLPDATVYASEVDNYNVKDREQLDDWVLYPLALYMEMEADSLGDDAAEILDDLAKAIQEVQDRLAIFPNKVVKDTAIDFRKQTGAKEIDDKLTGGKLPGGTGMWTKQSVNYRKA